MSRGCVAQYKKYILYVQLTMFNFLHQISNHIYMAVPICAWYYKYFLSLRALLHTSTREDS
jgi:hypothetical protein